MAGRPAHFPALTCFLLHSSWVDRLLHTSRGASRWSACKTSGSVAGLGDDIPPTTAPAQPSPQLSPKPAPHGGILMRAAPPPVEDDSRSVLELLPYYLHQWDR